MSQVKNMQSLDKVIRICTGLGGTYNPGQQNLRVDALINLLNNASNADASVSKARSEFEIATNTREVMFDGVPKLAARILSELKSSNVLEQTVADARTITRKMTGRKASRDPVPSEPAAQEQAQKRRARGQAFISVANNFSKLLQNLKDEPNYNPNTPDLKVEALQILVDQLRAANNRVEDARVKYLNARIERNNVFYLAAGNVCDTTSAVKLKVQAICGRASETYMAVAKVRVHKRKIL
jgi:hypothetical protein